MRRMWGLVACGPSGDRENPLLAIERPETEARLPALGGRDVLDLGAGDGHYARLAHARGARRVVAIDVAEVMLAGVSPTAAVAADGAALPLRAASFDVVIAALVLSYVDRPRVLAEVARVLRPGGMFVASDLHADGASRGGWRRTFPSRDGGLLVLEAPPPAPATLAAEIESAGIVVERCETTFVDDRLEPLFQRAGRGDFERQRGLPLLLHVAARRVDG